MENQECTNSIEPITISNKNCRFLAYELIDPETQIPRYIGITTRTLRQRFVGHVSDVNNRPNLNPHKTAWFLQLRKKGLIPEIRLVKECTNLEELKQFEIDYIKKYKEIRKLINQTEGGDHPGFRIHSRESILKRATTKAIVQYNVLGEKIAEYDIIEDAVRTLNLSDKSSGSHITNVCKGSRKIAYNYIWRYAGDELGDISDISPLSLKCCKLVQYTQEGEKIAEYTTYTEAAKALGLASEANIASCIAGKQNTCKGFIFKAEPLYAYFDQNLYESKIKEFYQNNARKAYKRKKSTNLIITVYKGDLIVGTFNSYSEASEFVIGTINGRKSIKECCEGKRDNYHGYIFKIES